MSCCVRPTVATAYCSVRPTSPDRPTLPAPRRLPCDRDPPAPSPALRRRPPRPGPPPPPPPRGRRRGASPVPAPRLPRHLLSAADLGRDEALLVLDTAEELALLADRPIKKLPTLRGRTVVNLFFEDWTRTRTSFEVAAKRLSADVINFSAQASSASPGASLKDTA